MRKPADGLRAFPEPSARRERDCRARSGIAADHRGGRDKTDKLLRREALSGCATPSHPDVRGGVVQLIKGIPLGALVFQSLGEIPL